MVAAELLKLDFTNLRIRSKDTAHASRRTADRKTPQKDTKSFRLHPVLFHLIEYVFLAMSEHVRKRISGPKSEMLPYTQKLYFLFQLDLHVTHSSTKLLPEDCQPMYAGRSIPGTGAQKVCDGWPVTSTTAAVSTLLCQAFWPLCEVQQRVELFFSFNQFTCHVTSLRNIILT